MYADSLQLKRGFSALADAKSGCLQGKLGYAIFAASRYDHSPQGLQFYHHRHYLLPTTNTSNERIFCRRLHSWHHQINSTSCGSNPSFGLKPSPTIIVLLGWLGAEQKRLKKYADWYTSRGLEAISFTLPMKDLLNLRAFHIIEEHADLLCEDLFKWLDSSLSAHLEKQDNGSKQIIFHTFSNTGWLMYGVMLERFIQKGGCNDFLNKIKGCIFYSAPCVEMSPQVWASGFSAAFLKKESVATHFNECNIASDGLRHGKLLMQKPSLKEVVLLTILQKFFSLFLKVPCVNKRLNELVFVLAHKQPLSSSQLYLYSSSDTVIPVGSIVSFIEEQRRIGRVVRAYDFKFSPHVDHFRRYPEEYSIQLASFLEAYITKAPD